MTELTLTELHGFLRSSAGESDDGSPPADFAETCFEDLGYDSLAVLETTNRIERTYGIKLVDPDADTVATPGALLDLANDRLRREAA